MPLTELKPKRTIKQIYGNILVFSIFLTLSLVFWIYREDKEKPLPELPNLPITQPYILPPRLKHPRIFYGKPTNPEVGDIYIDTLNNKTYRFRFTGNFKANKNTTTGNEPDWIFPAGKDYPINKDPNLKKLWEKTIERRKYQEKTLEDFDDSEIEDWYESRRD